MASMDEACATLFTHVGGAVVCALVDLDSGIILGLHPEGPEIAQLSGVLASGTARLLRGVVVGDLTRGLQKTASPPAEGSHLEEAQFTTNEHCFFCRTVAEGRVAIVLVTTRDVSVGMGWAQLKAALPNFESVVY